MNSNIITRRSLLVGAARSGLAGLAMSHLGCSERPPQNSRSGRSAVRASNRIALGFIGLGAHGTGVNLPSFLSQPDAEVVALCDVDAQRLAAAHDQVRQHYAEGHRSGTFKGCATTGDWRELVARADVDAVVISTPDHWHALPAVEAIRSGKDVFCEKPLSLTVHEGRVICDTTARYRCVFQVGTQNRSLTAFLRACESVRNGRIGRLHTIRVRLYRGHGATETDLRPDARPVSVPDWLDYDMWLGQAPEAPYTPARCHHNFRYNLDYSGGNLTDFGGHLFGVAQWGNDTERTGPLSVAGHGRFPKDGLYNVATDWEITYGFANGVTLICRSGGFYVRFEGTEGWVEADAMNVRASSPRLLEPPAPNDLHLRTCREREQRDFLDCVKSRSEPYAPAEVGHRSATLAHLGGIALRLRRKLAWNPGLEKFVDDDEANRMLSRTMRSPWRL